MAEIPHPPDGDVPDELLDAFETVLQYCDLNSFSWRELLLLAYYINVKGPTFGKGVQSALAAGYRGTRRSLASQASETIRKARACGLLDCIFEQLGATVEAAVRGLVDGLSARRMQGFMTSFGDVIVQDLGPDHGTILRSSERILKLRGVERPRPAAVAVRKPAIGQLNVAPKLPLEACERAASDDGAASSTSAERNSFRQEVDSLKPAAYDRTLTLTSVVAELVDIEAEINALKAKQELLQRKQKECE